MSSIPLTLFKYDFALLMRHGFVVAYGVIGFLYVVIVSSLPGSWADPILPVMVWSDPVFFGFFFAGATVCLDLSQGTFKALITTPLKPSVYFLVKSINLSLLAFVMALGIALVVRGLAFRPLILAIGILFGGAPAALLGAALALRLGSINRFMVGAIPWLVWLALPVFVYVGGPWLPEGVLWLARFSPADGAFRLTQAAFDLGRADFIWRSSALAALESLAWTVVVAKFALLPAIATLKRG